MPTERWKQRPPASFPPILPELVLPLAGFLASRGNLPGFAPVLGTATFGSFLEAFVLYTLGRRGGRPLVLRYGGHIGDAPGLFRLLTVSGSAVWNAMLIGADGTSARSSSS